MHTFITDIGPACGGHSPSTDGEGLWSYRYTLEGHCARVTARCADCGHVETFPAWFGAEPTIQDIREQHERAHTRVADESAHVRVMAAR
jgi:hypothetical protein